MRPSPRRRRRIQRVHHLRNAGAPSRQHAVLEAVPVLPVDRRPELAGEEAKKNSRGEVVLADPAAHLEVLMEHGLE